MLRVLLIEDGAENQLMMRRILNKTIECEVVVSEFFADAINCLQTAKEKNFDIVISDGNLKGGVSGPDGFKDIFTNHGQIAVSLPYVIIWSTCPQMKANFEKIFQDHSFTAFKCLTKPLSFRDTQEIIDVLKACLPQATFDRHSKPSCGRAVLSSSAPPTETFSALSLAPAPLSLSSIELSKKPKPFFSTPQPNKPKLRDEENDNDATNVIVTC